MQSNPVYRSLAEERMKLAGASELVTFTVATAKRDGKEKRATRLLLAERVYESSFLQSVQAAAAKLPRNGAKLSETDKFLREYSDYLGATQERLEEAQHIKGAGLTGNLFRDVLHIGSTTSLPYSVATQEEVSWLRFVAAELFLLDLIFVPIMYDGLDKETAQAMRKKAK